MSLKKVLRLCIVGAGPGGLYTADRLLRGKNGLSVAIDVLDKLPFPFGLVVTGVAPDHSSTRNVRSSFGRTLAREECRFIGRVELGKQVQLEQLRKAYHAVVLACGAEADRKLEVPGEEGKGIISAKNFVWWYNGHPEGVKKLDLSSVKRVGIIGAGNVAIDCARILLKPWTTFESTEMADRALNALKHSAVIHVDLIARRSAAHAKFTPKELRELTSLDRVKCQIDKRDLSFTPAEEAEIANARPKKRVVEILRNIQEKDSFDKSLTFHFSKRLREIELDKTSKAKSLLVETPAGKSERLEVDLVIPSIGTKGVPVADLPFDHDRGVIPNQSGRVIGSDKTVGVYVTGWLKRGATGIIGTNLLDAEEVADSILEDAPVLMQRTPSINLDWQ